MRSGIAAVVIYQIINSKYEKGPNSGAFLLSTNINFGSLQNAYCVHEIATGQLVCVFPVLAVFV